ncbi:MAG TPA: hypothetical protein PK760_04715, partial [Flavobacteriales bacterium]|nr:hypothetical protein [Flavobacteriales bacterium]
MSGEDHEEIEAKTTTVTPHELDSPRRLFGKIEMARRIIDRITPWGLGLFCFMVFLEGGCSSHPLTSKPPQLTSVVGYVDTLAVSQSGNVMAITAWLDSSNQSPLMAEVVSYAIACNNQQLLDSLVSEKRSIVLSVICNDSVAFRTLYKSRPTVNPRDCSLSVEILGSLSPLQFLQYEGVYEVMIHEFGNVDGDASNFVDLIDALRAESKQGVTGNGTVAFFLWAVITQYPGFQVDDGYALSIWAQCGRDTAEITTNANIATPKYLRSLS